MTTKTQYKCDRCGKEEFNQFNFCEYHIGGTYRENGHLCDSCREKVVAILKEKASWPRKNCKS